MTSVETARPASRPVLLELRKIALSFEGVNAITEVSFKVYVGEILAIIGPNGAGKSSLLNIINGLYRPQEGVIRFGGEERSRMHPHHAATRGIARTFQNLALFKGMTVLENVLTGRNLKTKSSIWENALGLPRARREESEQRAKVEEILELLRIQRHRHAIVGKLPYGLQKRVELGRALAAEPKLLLLDEPMAGMNFEEKQEMSGFILDVNTELGTTVVLIEHDMAIVMGISDRIVVLDHGWKIAEGSPDEVRASRAVIDAYLGVAHSEAS